MAEVASLALAVLMRNLNGTKYLSLSHGSVSNQGKHASTDGWLGHKGFIFPDCRDSDIPNFSLP